MDWFLLVNALFLFTGAGIYLGTNWTVKFFLAPSWGTLATENIQERFTDPIQIATRFFMTVVPLMLVSSVIVIIDEWGDRLSVPGWICAASIAGSSYVFRGLIFPVNKKIIGGDYDGPAGLKKLLDRWLFLNDFRFAGAVLIWASSVWYLADKGNLLGAFS